MATLRLQTLLRFRRGLISRIAPLKNVIQQQSIRWRTTTSYGGVTEHPIQIKFGLLKTFVVVMPFLYIGATISKEGAAFLEENDIFVPEDDDD